MTSAPPAGVGEVPLDELRVGPLLAEGGEGRVYLLPRQPHLLYKAYRRPADRSHLAAMVAWPGGLDGEAADRLRGASAWPVAVVAGDGGHPSGLLVPRAPRRFSVRHRDGHSRLASLSYLTADPAHRSAAYGLTLPPPSGPERVGLVYALARLLDTFGSGAAPVGHGDLSTKNVLWSLQRGPEIFVIDCDNAEIFRPDGSPAGDGGRRRAMTPNWDDPAVPKGTNPTLASDRYSLALIFLRLVGAANFPIQARQRAGGPVTVEFPVRPGPGSRALLDPDAPVWDLVGRALSVTDPDQRPPASAWVGELGRLLGEMGVEGQAPARRPAPVSLPAGAAADVVVRPVPGPDRPGRTWAKVSPNPRYAGAPASGGGAGSSGAGPGPGGLAWQPLGPGVPAGQPAGAGPGGPVGVGPPAGERVVSGPAVWPEVRVLLGRAARWWVGLHRAMIGFLLTPGRRRAGIGSLAFCAAVDLALASIVVVFGAVILAPVLGV